jgi:hypothetical protein
MGTQNRRSRGYSSRAVQSVQLSDITDEFQCAVRPILDDLAVQAFPEHCSPYDVFAIDPLGAAHD